MIFLDHNWTSQWSTSVATPEPDIDSLVGQDDDASIEREQYALGNLLYTPVPNVMMGGEVQWGRREMWRDPFVGTAFNSSSR